jgi:coenzyme F420-reducing hydrogenase alpha subunit
MPRGVKVRISEQDREEIQRLIKEAESLAASDSEAFLRWLQASQKALSFDPLQEQRFKEYCRTSWGTRHETRVRTAVRMLKQALSREDKPA